MLSAQSSISSRVSRAWRLAFVDDLLCLTLGELDDLRLRGLANRLLACLAENPVALPLRLGEHLLPLLDDPAGLLDLLRDRRPHLVEDVVDLLAIDADLVGQRHGLRVVHEVVELVDENEYVHESSDITEEALFASSAEEAAEEAALLWWFRRWFWFRGGLRFRYGLRLRFGFRLSLFLWLRFRLGPQVRARARTPTPVA
jgi:hypothetical protein